jgi:hypothetical protein
MLRPMTMQQVTVPRHTVRAEVEPVGSNRPVVDVVVPVYNEIGILERSVRQLHEYLTGEFPFSWCITIADNGSTDGTAIRARRLAETLPNVRAICLDRKGRGYALRSAWAGSDAFVVAYMDVDLSTDLDGLLPLVAPLVTGHSDVAIGSRLAPGASVARGPKREFISRAYNALLRTVFATPVRDAQCGFKAVRADVARRLLPAVRDDKWFFDTELLLLARHNGLRIHEVPVDWTDDDDSRVDVLGTARDDLAGVLRMVRTLASGRGSIDLGPNARSEPVDDMGRRVVVFARIGAVSTLVSLLVFVLALPALGAVGANALAVTATFVGNAWANARFTARRGRPVWPAASALYAVSLALTSLALVFVDEIGFGVVAQLAVLAATWALASIARLVVVTSWTR